MCRRVPSKGPPPKPRAEPGCRRGVQQEERKDEEEREDESDRQSTDGERKGAQLGLARRNRRGVRSSSGPSRERTLSPQESRIDALGPYIAARVAIGITTKRVSPNQLCSTLLLRPTAQPFQAGRRNNACRVPALAAEHARIGSAVSCAASAGVVPARHRHLNWMTTERAASSAMGPAASCPKEETRSLSRPGSTNAESRARTE